MGYRRVPFAVDEYYHCYNRGVDKRVVFGRKKEYQRFQELLYLANDTRPIQRSFLENYVHEEIFSLPRLQPIVAIGAYCLMPNHIHILIREIIDGGISRFMHKVGTGYTMYFNIAHQRVGNLFVKPFRSKHVDSDVYLQHVGNYIHLNPAELSEAGWKTGVVKNMRALEVAMREYPYSGFADYNGAIRPQSAILHRELVGLDQSEDIITILRNAQEYYAETADMIEKLK